MIVHHVWDLRGNERQNAIVLEALDACDYPFEWLKVGLVAKKGKETIPVEWADLSRWAEVSAAQAAEGHGSDHAHKGKDYDTIEARGRVLGLAWYSGKVTLDVSLEWDPPLAKEVKLSEGAHMIDFFVMDDEQRNRLYRLFHGDNDSEHGHGWFDVGTYREWVGEAFMGGFIQMFAPTIPVTIGFAHGLGGDFVRKGRRVLLGPRLKGNSVKMTYHREWHRILAGGPTFLLPEDAEAAGYRRCRYCRPR